MNLPAETDKYSRLSQVRSNMLLMKNKKVYDLEQVFGGARQWVVFLNHIINVFVMGGVICLRM